LKLIAPKLDKPSTFSNYLFYNSAKVIVSIRNPMIYKIIAVRVFAYN